MPMSKSKAAVKNLGHHVEAGSPIREPCERRTAQFEIQRPCPQTGNGRTLREHLPIAVWVEWPPEDNKSHGCSAAKVYKSIPGEAIRVASFIDAPHVEGGYLCEHMGRLIE